MTSEPRVTSVMFRWLVLTMVLIVAVTSIVIAYWTGIIFPRKIERINFESSLWYPTSSDLRIYLFISNTGADELTINKVWINETLLDSTEWKSFPSMGFEPEDQGVLRIIPSTIGFKRGATYQFTIVTVAGNSFPYTATARTGSHDFAPGRPQQHILPA